MHPITAPYTSAQNGKSECLHRTIMGRARAMWLDARLPPSLWAKCALAAFYLAQRTPTCALKGMTPYEAFYGKKPRVSHLREYGCRAFVLIQNKVNPKIYQRSEECVLVGYTPNSKAYRCWNRKNKRIVTSYNVDFIELQDATTQPQAIVLELNGTDDSMDNTKDDYEEEDMTVEVQPLTDGYGMGAIQHQDQTPGIEGETCPVPIPAPVQLRRSSRKAQASAAGAAMQGLTYRSRLDRARDEVWAGATHTKSHQVLALLES
jgi:hypothetical protein